MAARHKKFISKKKITDFEPLSFELNSQKFNVKPAIQGGFLLEFVSAADSDSGGKAAGALWDFFKYCMDEEEYARFQKLLDDPEIIIDIEVIGEIVSYLVEEYTGRPTEQAELSSSGA